MLRIEDLESGYGSMQVLWKIHLGVAQGTITSLLGPNGAGKSTLLSSVFGSVVPWGGSVTFQGEDITTVACHRKVDMGIALVPEGKHLFPGMSVRENLLMGAYLKKALRHRDETLDLVHRLFPRLEERADQAAGSLSGGEQQMVTIARALMTRPELIMLDEPSQGLAPLLVRMVFDTIDTMKKDMGLTILLVEQNASASLDAADHVYIIHEGLIKAEGAPDQIKGSEEVRHAYLGL